MDVGTTFKKLFDDPRMPPGCRQYKRSDAVFAARINCNPSVEKFPDDLDLAPTSRFAERGCVVTRIEPLLHY